MATLRQRNPKSVEGLYPAVPVQQSNLTAGLFDQNPGQIAAVILEPATADGGSAEFLQALKALTARQGALLIYDEVVTGFRLARGGAQEYYDVVPDMAVFAKALANGMPLSAVTGRREIMQLSVVEDWLASLEGTPALVPDEASFRANRVACLAHEAAVTGRAVSLI